MSTFVDECRREWRRLGVPDLIADEMASDLEADLAEARADGVPEAEILGESDPRRFAESWASARGLASERMVQPRKLRRFWPVAVAGTVLLAIGVVLGIVFVVLGARPTIHRSIMLSVSSQPVLSGIELPNLVGVRVRRADKLLTRDGLRVKVRAVRYGRKGIVQAQTPSPGLRLRRGSVVRLSVGAAKR